MSFIIKTSCRLFLNVSRRSLLAPSFRGRSHRRLMSAVAIPLPVSTVLRCLPPSITKEEQDKNWKNLQALRAKLGSKLVVVDGKCLYCVSSLLLYKRKEAYPTERRGCWLMTPIRTDDPTGTQSVVGIPVLADWSVEALERELRDKTSPAFFLLSNVRWVQSWYVTTIYCVLR